MKFGRSAKILTGAAVLFLSISSLSAPHLVRAAPAATHSATIVANPTGGHTCALTSEGAAKCWGFNAYGQLGIGPSNKEFIPKPVDVIGLGSGARSIGVGFSHSCAVTSGGAAVCWGYNNSGQLGDGTTMESRDSPFPVFGLSSGISAIAIANEYSCALTNAGAVRCWGRIFDRDPIHRKPVPIAGLQSGVASISAGDGHACVVTTAGGAKCWGYNTHGELGDGTRRYSPTPVTVSGLESGVVAISAGSGHTCAVTTSGAAKCWGGNFHGELGDGTTTDRVRPVIVKTFSNNVATITAGNSHTCALTVTAGARCWGYGEYGQIGNGKRDADTELPVPVLTLGKGIVISAGYYYTCALIEAGAAKCWGFNETGKLGDGTQKMRLTPVVVNGFRS